VRVVRLAAVAMLSCVTSPALCHGAQELGHHWDSAAYLGEMRLQVLVICCTACALVVGSWIVRAVRKRQAGR